MRRSATACQSPHSAARYEPSYPHPLYANAHGRAGQSTQRALLAARSIRPLWPNRRFARPRPSALSTKPELRPRSSKRAGAVASSGHRCCAVRRGTAMVGHAVVLSARGRGPPKLAAAHLARRMGAGAEWKCRIDTWARSGTAGCCRSTTRCCTRQVLVVVLQPQRAQAARHVVCEHANDNAKQQGTRRERALAQNRIGRPVAAFEGGK
jgi:hypothetical protein